MAWLASGRSYLPAEGVQEEGVDALVKLAQLPGPALLGHLSPSLHHSGHQQRQVAEDLLPLGLVLGNRELSWLTPRAQFLPLPTLGLGGVFYAPVPLCVPTGISFSTSAACASPAAPSPALWAAPQCQHRLPSPSHRFGFPLLESEVHQGQHCRAGECGQCLALALEERGDAEVRYQELCPSLSWFLGGTLLTTVFSMSLASSMYLWMSLLSQTSPVGLARPSSTCRRKDVRRSSPGGDRVGHRATSLGSSCPGPCLQGQPLALACSDRGGPMVGVQGEMWGG